MLGIWMKNGTLNFHYMYATEMLTAKAPNPRQREVRGKSKSAPKMRLPELHLLLSFHFATPL